MKKNLDEKIYIIFVLFSLLISVFIFSFFNSKVSMDNMNIKVNKDNYKIDISYLVTPVSSINSKIKNMINKNRNDFLKNVDDIKKNNINSTYKLVVDYEVRKYNNIYFIHFIILSYTGGNNYIRKDVSYYYNIKTNKEIKENDFFKNNSLGTLSKLAYEELIKISEDKNSNLDKKWIKETTLPLIGNYSNLYLNEKGLNIIFLPYQISFLTTDELTINIPYNKLKNILKTSYYDKNYILPIYERNIDDFKDKKVVAFTFDDGPNPDTTLRLLEGLKRRNARATFFLLGNRVSNYPDVVKKIYENGNQIGSHTFHHYQLTKLNDDEIRYEVESTNEEIRKITGNDPILLRPPYGSVNRKVREISNMYIILWNVDTLDWKYRDKDVVYNNIIKDASDGSIILLHDLYDSSVDGVLMAIDELKKQGYEFVTIDEMFYLKKTERIKDKNYFSF